MKLTKEDVQAIKQADRFVVRLDNGTAKLEAIKRIRAKKDGPFSSEETELRFTIEGPAHSNVSATFVCLYPHGQWEALALIVRPGDELKFSARTNGNGYLEAAVIPAGKLEHHYSGYDKLYHDELTVSVFRSANGRSKTIIREMILDDSICPDNSARAIRS